MTGIKAWFGRGNVRWFLALAAVALAWSVYTQHAWEDYYITYRAAKNLATGQGLTFTVGERVHSFTSPLGVLLPALASLLTSNRSDQVALWIFRIFSIAAFAGAGAVLWNLARRLNWGTPAAALLVVLLATDTKIVDFSTNGMETAFLLLFLAWTLRELLCPAPRQALRLGTAWAGLMWTRPDACMYIAALTLGAWLFAGPWAAWSERLRLLKTYVVAAFVASLLYAPWLVWAKWYYGTPLPHTIVAKGLFSPPITLQTLIQWLGEFPRRMSEHHDYLGTTFMPPYSYHTGWPDWASQISYWVSLPLLVVWLIPGVRREAKVASLGFFCGQFYLATLVGFPVPWYFPLPAALALFVIASLAGQADSALRRESPPAWAFVRRAARALTWTACGTLVLGAATVFVLSAYELRVQQRMIESGVRTDIGRWLHEHARSPADTVFLEPLGYIGFYSNLKMYDYPGLSSREVVAARKRASSRNYPDCWGELIVDLQPDWLVLRPHEAMEIRRYAPLVLSDYYRLVKTWDVRAEVQQFPFMPGRAYLLNDAYFEIYHRQPGWPKLGDVPVKSQKIADNMFEVNETFGGPTHHAGLSFPAHAPSRLVFAKPAEARWFTGSYWIDEGAYNRPPESHDYTDGAEFAIRFIAADGTSRELLRRVLAPRFVEQDRGVQVFKFELPAGTAGKIELTVGTGPANSSAFDWAAWGDLQLLVPVP